MSYDLTPWRSSDTRLQKLRARSQKPRDGQSHPPWGTWGLAQAGLMSFKAYFWDRGLGRGRGKLGNLVAMEMACSLGLRAGQ